MVVVVHRLLRCGLLQIGVELRDLAQPHQLYLPIYSGQFNMLVAVTCFSLFAVGSFGLLAAWGAVIWNADVSQGKPNPVWRWSSAYRGW